jgi:glycosyltransferase involved in cell wall biosynthesis
VANAKNRARSRPAARRTTRSGGGSAPDGAGTRRILWASNAPWAPTGYGEQTQQAIQRFRQDGHEVAVAANYGLEAMVTEWDGFKVYPRGLDAYSNDVIPAYAMDWGKPSGVQPLVITLFDCWVFRGGGWDTLERIASWVPIDHFPVPPNVAEWLARPTVTPIAMSKFGHDAIARLGIEAEYIPHAIDLSIFKPTEQVVGTEGAIQARRWMGVPDDAYVVGMVSANKGTVDRKSFSEAFLAMSMVMQKRDDVWLYLHTEPSPAMQGLDLRALLRATGVPEDRVRFVDSYSYRMGIPKEALAAIYTALDLLLAPSRGEGFGIPVLEAQACGTPVIVSNATAQPELVGDGIAVEVQPLWDPAQGAWWFTPHVPAIVDAVDRMYSRGRDRSFKGIEFTKQYDADTVYAESWRPVLDMLLTP